MMNNNNINERTAMQSKLDTIMGLRPYTDGYTLPWNEIDVNGNTKWFMRKKYTTEIISFDDLPIPTRNALFIFIANNQDYFN